MVVGSSQDLHVANELIGSYASDPCVRLFAYVKPNIFFFGDHHNVQFGMHNNYYNIKQ